MWVNLKSEISFVYIYIIYIYFFFFFLMIRRPPRSTLFPTRRSSDLIILSTNHKVLLFLSFIICMYMFTSAKSFYVPHLDRKSTRLNSSHLVISYAVFCLKKKTQISTWCISSIFRKITVHTQPLISHITWHRITFKHK